MNLPSDAVTRIAEELGRARLGDPRRSRRVARVGAKLAAAPESSIPHALEEDAQVQAAYRLMNNRRVTFEAVLEPHIEAAVESARRVGEVLLLHDTTDCSFPSLDPREVGYLQTGKAGFQLHFTLALDAGAWRRPLGVVHAEAMFRSQRRRRKSRRVSGSETVGRADSEFGRWWRGVKSAGDRLAGCQRVVHVADRESDSYDLMSQALEAKQEFVLRVRVHGRRGRNGQALGMAWSTVRQVAAGCEGIVEREVALSRRKMKSAPGMNKAHPPRKGRLARLQFAATTVVIPRPAYMHDPTPSSLKLNLVHVTEVDPPPGEPAVEWLLYSTLPV